MPTGSGLIMQDIINWKTGSKLNEFPNCTKNAINVANK